MARILIRIDLRGLDPSGGDLNHRQLALPPWSLATRNGMNLIDAGLSGTNLRRANLKGRILKDTNFSRLDFLENAALSGRSPRKANLKRAILASADFSETDPSGQDFSGMNSDEANLGGANLSKANLEGAILKSANLSGTNLASADLSRASFKGVDLREADLSTVKLRGVNLSGQDLRRADLSGADLNGANLQGADLREANLSTANLNWATLTDACLWKTQQAGWSIRGIFCESAYWNRSAKARTTYSPGEFERNFSVETKSVLPHEAGIQIGEFYMDTKYKILGGIQGAVGDNAESHGFIQKSSNQLAESIDLYALAKELALIRDQAKQQATEPEHDVAVGELALAEMAAKKEDEKSVFVHLKAAGKWALDIATKIGTSLTVEILKKAIGVK